jgi:hypothetical protein
VEHLPAYAPQLDYWQLSEAARKTLKRMRRRSLLSVTFWKEASLWPDKRYIMRGSMVLEGASALSIVEFIPASAPSCRSAPG